MEVGGDETGGGYGQDEGGEHPEKFFRLLEMDRESPEFERLFREVDEALARLAAEQADVSP